MVQDPYAVLGVSRDASDEEIKKRLQKRGIRLTSITDYYMDQVERSQHRFILNYSSLDMEGLESALVELHQIVTGKYRKREKK